MPRFKKKPVVITAVQFRRDNWEEMCEHLGESKARLCYVTVSGSDWLVYGEPMPAANFITCAMKIGLQIPTLEGDMLAIEGDWVIRGIKNELYPCKPDIFEATYEAEET